MPYWMDRVLRPRRGDTVLYANARLFLTDHKDGNPPQWWICDGPVLERIDKSKFLDRFEYNQYKQAWEMKR